MTRYLIQQKITRKTFRLPVTSEQAYSMLLSAYKAEVMYRRREFIDGADLRAHIKSIADFATSASTKFGFMLIGNCGNGKTTLLYAFQNLLNYLVRREVIDADYGLQIIDAREITMLAKDYKQVDKLKKATMLAIEDMGRESTEVLDYGNVYNPVIDLLEYRYDQQLFTAFTSNLSVDELAKKYGARITDRFREMFLKVVFANQSYRK